MIAATSFFSDPEVRVSIDPGVVLSVAQAQGYVSPEDARLLLEKVERAEVDLERLRQVHPDWKAEIDAAVAAFNKGNLDDAMQAFARVDQLISASQAELRAEEARSKYTQATLFYPFDFTKATPLLCEAAELAATTISYWIDCGAARSMTSDLEETLGAYQAAADLARDADQVMELVAALEGIGDVRRAEGQFDAALAAYTEGLNISRKRAEADPGSAEAAGAVSVSLASIGQVHADQDQYGASLKVYVESLDILRGLARQNPGEPTWAYEASATLTIIAEILIHQGQSAAALGAYTESLGLARTLAGQDPDDVYRANAVSVSLSGLGFLKAAGGQFDAALEAFAESVEILRANAARDPGNAFWNHQVSVELGKVGRVHLMQGQLDDALDVLIESLDIARALAIRDPENVFWELQIQNVLSLIGDVRMAQGQPDAALAAYGEGLGILRALAAQDPGNAALARHVMVSLWQMAEVDQADGAGHWAAVVAYMEEMEASGILLPDDKPFLPTARENLAAASE